MKQIITNPDVQQLIKQFDLETPKMYNILIDDYELDNGRIIINSAKVLSDKMEFIRFADMSRLIDSLDKCNIIFNAGVESTVKSN